MHPLIIGSVTIIVVILGLLILTIWLTTFQPKAVQTEVVRCAETAPVLKPGQRVKLLTYNVQFMAGKNYVFFFDLPDLSGPDERPSTADITHTLDEVARIIRDEAPDIILLQEVDEGAARTDYEDQVAQLLERLPADYACHTSAFYWQAICTAPTHSRRGGEQAFCHF